MKLIYGWCLDKEVVAEHRIEFQECDYDIIDGSSYSFVGIEIPVESLEGDFLVSSFIFEVDRELDDLYLGHTPEYLQDMLYNSGGIRFCIVGDSHV